MFKFDASKYVNYALGVDPDKVEHYGIRGMRWGVRRSRRQLDRGKGTSRDANDGNKVIRAKRKQDKKQRRRLDDKSIDEKINRLEKEKKLRDLINADIAPGRTFATKIMKRVGEKTLSSFLEGSIKYGVKYAATKEFDAKDFAAYIAPKPKNK